MKTFNSITEARVFSTQHPEELTEFKWFNEDGNLEEHIFFCNGNRHGEYKWFHHNGSIKAHYFYKNGNRHREYKWFYPDGTLNEHCFYLNGNLHGEYKTFHKNGTINEHCFFLNDEHQPQLQYLTIDRDETTLTLLFGDNYENIR